MTNKEKFIKDINNFTTDELADFLSNLNICSDCCSKKNHDCDCHHYCLENIEEWLNTKYPLQEGTLVKIVDTGKMYTTNVAWVLDNINDKDLIAKYAYDASFYGEGIGKAAGPFKVIKIVDDKAYIQRFYEWSDTGDACYLIDIDGLEEIEKGE